MKSAKTFIIIFLFFVFLATAMPAFAQSDRNDITEINRLSYAWIKAWSPQENAKNFSFIKRFKDFYAKGNNLILFDNADPQARIATSAKEYGTIWDSLLPNLAYVDNHITREPEIFVNGNLAVSTFVWETTFVSSNGKEQRVPTIGTLVWQKTAQGWRIIHEHGTALSDRSGGAGS